MRPVSWISRLASKVALKAAQLIAGSLNNGSKVDQGTERKSNTRALSVTHI